MGVAYNPQIVTQGLVFSVDAASQKSISALGCTGFNNAPQLLRNLISSSDVINSYNGIRLGNLNYYTVFAIDYPESSFGGDAASRDGITPGYNVRSGAKIFDFGRALHYAVYNNPTQSWVKTSIYDSYLGTAAVDTFVSEYATAVATYPDAIHIVAGSHRDSYHTTAQYNILRDLGAPSNVDSIIGFSSPEWILIGKPGLGAGNAYGWVFQNYSTDPTRVAHINFGLPIYGTKDNYLEFDGTDDYISVPYSSALDTPSGATYSIWIYPTSSGEFLTRGTSDSGATPDNPRFYIDVSVKQIYFDWSSPGLDRYVYTSSNSFENNKWMNIVGVAVAGGRLDVYINGSLCAYQTRSNADAMPSPLPNTNNEIQIGGATWIPRYFGGRISSVNLYNRALSASEIQQNFNALRGRFGI